MNRIYIPTSSPDDWRHFLSKSETQWRSGYSAKELAECWERSNGFPVEFHDLFSRSGIHVFSNLELLAAFPEYQVNLPDGKRPSQNDIFILGRTQDGELASIMVEGKVAEPFGETLEAWLKDASEGKKNRLRILCNILGLSREPPLNIRYQLFHRMVSAILEAKRFNAKYAMMIVHSFSSEHRWFSDYQDFLRLFEVESRVGQLVELPESDGLRVFTGWVVGQQNGE